MNCLHDASDRVSALADWAGRATPCACDAVGRLTGAQSRQTCDLLFLADMMQEHPGWIVRQSAFYVAVRQLGGFFYNYRADDDAAEQSGNAQPEPSGWPAVAKDVQTSSSQGTPPKTWGGSTIRIIQCDSDLDCVFGDGQ